MKWCRLGELLNRAQNLLKIYIPGGVIDCKIGSGIKTDPALSSAILGPKPALIRSTREGSERCAPVFAPAQK
jgi:hypothetical protein